MAAGPLRAQAVADEPVTLATVEVTGSHIRRVEFETAQPLLVLDRARLLQTGLSNVGEILQQLPAHGSDLNSDYNNGGNGETRVDLRNLGASRTLVLVNGHRYVNTLDGAVDVGSIPLPIVERIEVLTDGASAIYGSDAIAGVVNVITRRDYAGAEANVYYASSEHGDGERRAVDATWGRVGERGGFVVNLSFADQQAIWAGDRPISAVPTFGLPPDDAAARASVNTPDGRFGFGPGGNRLPDGTVGEQLTWDPQLADHRVFDFRSDSYNFAPENYLRTPYERTALFAQAHYDLSPRLVFRSELLLHRRRSSQQLAPTPINQLASDDPRQRAIATDNLYNPFAQPVTFFSFRPLGRDRRFEQDVRTHYLSGGLEGTLQIGRRGFDWELNLIDARTREEQAISGGYDLIRLGLGVGPSFRDGSGMARCGTAPAPVPDCVPLDFLHGNAGFTESDVRLHRGKWCAGRGAQAARRGRRHQRRPAGPSCRAPGTGGRNGVPARERPIRLDPLLSDDAIDFGGVAPEPIDGEIRASEAYVELNLPLLARQPFAHALDLSLAARYSDYSTFGNTSNHKLGIGWRPHRDWLVRASWSQGYRAPSASELFAVSGSFQATALAVADLRSLFGRACSGGGRTLPRRWCADWELRSAAWSEDTFRLQSRPAT